MESLRNDLRFAVRSIRRAPGFAIVACLTLAVGIGAVTATFSVANGLLLRPLPLPAQDRVIVMWAKQRDFAHVPLKWSDIDRYGKESRAFARVAGIDYNGTWTWALSERGEAVPAKGTFVTGGLFQALGIMPQLGRVIDAADDVPNAPRVAVISDALWRRRYGADSGVIGRVLDFDRKPITIVGVAPRGFEYPLGVEFWTPVRAFAPNVPSDSIPSSLDLVARLNPDATIDQARRELDGYLARAYAKFRTSVGTFEATARTLPDAIIGTVRPAVLTLTAAALLVLAIACLNVANLQLVRGVSRVREVAIRASLGASTGRVLRQLLTEAGVIGAAGAVAGIALAALTIRALVSLAPAEIPRVAEVTLDASVVAFATIVTIVTVALSAIGPTLALARSDVASLVRRAGTRSVAGSRRSARTRQGLIVAQAALAVLVLSGAGLLVRSLANLQQQDLGFKRENVIVAQLTMPWSKFDTPDGGDRFNQLLERVRSTIAATPGVTHVAAASSPPYSGTGGWDALPTVEGQSADVAVRRPWVNMEIVTSDYFATLGVPLLRGRLIAPTDRKRAEQVIVVNATMARLYWPGEDPLGKRMLMGAGTDPTAPKYRVVGVVGDMRYRELTVAMPSFYLPNEQYAGGAATFFLVRTTSSPSAIVPTIRAIFKNADADAIAPRCPHARRLSRRATRSPAIRIGAGRVLCRGRIAARCRRHLRDRRRARARSSSRARDPHRVRCARNRRSPFRAPRWTWAPDGWSGWWYRALARERATRENAALRSDPGGSSLARWCRRDHRGGGVRGVCHSASASAASRSGRGPARGLAAGSRVMLPARPLRRIVARA